jgi:hypothetical protein
MHDKPQGDEKTQHPQTFNSRFHSFAPSFDATIAAKL